MEPTAKDMTTRFTNTSALDLSNERSSKPALQEQRQVSVPYTPGKKKVNFARFSKSGEEEDEQRLKKHLTFLEGAKANRIT